jgi:SAM-dependent methyltransferase
MIALAPSSPGSCERGRRHQRGGLPAAPVIYGVGVEWELWPAYDAMGPDYEWHAADSAANARYGRPAVLAALGPVAGRWILDAACGPGLYVQELADRRADVTAVGAARSWSAWPGRGSAGGVVVGRAVPGAALPCPDAAFDLVVSALAIRYAGDRGAALAEFFGVLRPGGAAVISTRRPVIDWLRKGGSCFGAALETGTWRLSGGGQPVRFWREPLSAVRRCHRCRVPDPAPGQNRWPQGP